MASQSEWVSHWPLLSEARDRLDSIVITGGLAAPIADLPVLTLTVPDEEPVRLATAAFRDMIRCGEVPVFAIRGDCGRRTPERVQDLLAAASNAAPYFDVNQIVADFDSCCDRSMFGPRSTLIDTALYPPAEHSQLQIVLFDVQIHWPSLIEKLKAVGILADTTPDSATAELESDLPRRAAAIKVLPVKANEGAKAGAAEASIDATVSRLVEANVTEAPVDLTKPGSIITEPPQTPSTNQRAALTEPEPRCRGAYYEPLAEWMAPQKIAKLRGMSYTTIANYFRLYCEQERPELLPLLPKRSRSMESEIKRIITRRDTALRAPKKN